MSSRSIKNTPIKICFIASHFPQGGAERPILELMKDLIAKGYEKELFDLSMVKEAFRISDKLKTQLLALYFIRGENSWRVVEISFGVITVRFYDDCLGYFDRELTCSGKQVKL